ncbi:hypothetical protein SLEP1_g25343 [Rubroshorea leprosula]|uniref:Uncharacterized protein n=1 Tax=Rubroshorea leprosula TaxID=152421 RepID=A0AAV5JT33_9ROSI|nr:hypothetical protein SLEP1_g25343 [Rubroshorea leprosula]
MESSRKGMASWKVVGDGVGGGITLAGTCLDKETLTLAENVYVFFNSMMNWGYICAIRTLVNSTIQLHIERLTNRCVDSPLNGFNETK